MKIDPMAPDGMAGDWQLPQLYAAPAVMQAEMLMPVVRSQPAGVEDRPISPAYDFQAQIVRPITETNGIRLDVRV